MWGGFDLANISQLGNQLGEALQRAKHELDTKLDQTFTFDEKPSAPNSGSANDDGDVFTVDAGGFIMSTGHERPKQPSTTQDLPTPTHQHQQATAAEAPTATPVDAPQNGHARSFKDSDATQISAISAETVSHEGLAAAASGARSSKQVKKKLVRKVVRIPHADSDAASVDVTQKLLAAGADSTASSGSSAAANGYNDVAVSRGSTQQATADDAGASTPATQADEARAAQHHHHQHQQQQHEQQSEQHWGGKQSKGLAAVKMVLQHPEQQSAHDQADLQRQQQQQRQAEGQQWPEQLAEEQLPVPVQQRHSDLPGQTPSVAPIDEQQQLDTASLLQMQTAVDGQQQAQGLSAQGRHLRVGEHSSSSDQPEVQAAQTTDQQQDDWPVQQLADGWQQHPDLPLDIAAGEVEAGVTHLKQQEAHLQHEQQQQHHHHHHQQQQQEHTCHKQQQQQQRALERHEQQEAQLFADQQQQQQQEKPQRAEDADTGVNTADGSLTQTALENGPSELPQQLSSQDSQVQQHQLEQEQQSPLDFRQQQQQQHTDDLISGLQQHCHELQQQLQQREGQLTRQAQRLGELEVATSALSDAKVQLEQVVAALTAKNEQLVLRASKVNEEEMQELQQEATDRLAAAERKVFALIKERDALKRAAAAAAAAAGGDDSNDVKRLEADLRKKDELVTQLMEEGQKLSKRQLDLESAIKKLRQQLKASETDKEKLNALLAAERAEAEGLRRAKTKAERDLVAAVEAGRQELEAVRQQGEEQLLKAQSDKAAAEAHAAEAAAEGLAGQLQSSEARASALAETVAELQEALDRHRTAADRQEEALRQELADLERRAQTAELRHQELSAKLPEATAPLLRQISALQEAAAAQAQVWAAAERSLTARVYDAEAAAAAAAEREGDAHARVTTLQARLSAAEQAAAGARSSAAEAATRAARADERLALTEQQLEDAQAAVQEVQAAADQLREQLKQHEAAYKRKLGNEAAARRAAEEELTRTRQELSQLQGMMGPGVRGLGALQTPGTGTPGFGVPQPPDQQQSDMWRVAAGPPALAAPGFRWILVREGADGTSAAAANGEDGGGSLPGTPHSAASAGAAGSKLMGQGSSASSAAAAGFFDTSELLLQSDTASASGAAGAAGGGTPLSPISSSALQLHQAQLRAVQQRLGGGSVSEAQLQKLRAALRQKVGECAALQARVRELEDTRDQLAGELVRATQDAKQASDAVAELPKLQQAVRELEARYAAAVELVGERDEQLEELSNDLEDVKQLYRQQIETLLTQVAQTD